jgi:acetoin utilization deacetylase AcuC-like enzyme
MVKMVLVVVLLLSLARRRQCHSSFLLGPSQRRRRRSLSSSSSLSLSFSLRRRHPAAFTTTTTTITSAVWTFFSTKKQQRQHVVNPFLPSFYHRHYHHPVESSSRRSGRILLLRFCSSSSSSSTTNEAAVVVAKDEEEAVVLFSFEDDANDENDKVVAAVAQPEPSSITPAMPSLQIFYNDVYDVILPKNHRFPMAKYGQVRRLVQDWVVLSQKEHQQQQQQLRCDFRISPLATVQELVTTHSAEYVQRFLSGNLTRSEIRNVGFPWSPSGVKRALSSVGGTVAAACHVCEHVQLQQRQQLQQTHQDDANKNHVVVVVPRTVAGCCWSAHVAGGTHHAFYDHGEGFCVFSDMAVAANVVLKRYPHVIQGRILMLDLDVHQGNGNAVLFQDEPRVFTFSMHCRDNYFSPRQQSDLDIELPAGCNDATYLATLHHWLKQLEQENNNSNKDNKGDRFDLIFYQAGVDVLACDRLGRMNLTAAGVAKRNDMVYRFATKINAPLAITMGGGYPSSASSSAATTPRDEDEDNTATATTASSQKDKQKKVEYEYDGWTPIIEAHANVYIQAYQYLARLGDRKQ